MFIESKYLFKFCDFAWVKLYVKEDIIDHISAKHKIQVILQIVIPAFQKIYDILSLPAN